MYKLVKIKCGNSQCEKEQKVGDNYKAKMITDFKQGWKLFCQHCLKDNYFSLIFNTNK